ncbi:MAG: hypothetical protein K2J64_09110 [Desulfovibrio sp.]|nr:hypothetical protein [Desulfovibrio sp.]
MIDLNHEEEQRERNYGPVPAGSRVLLRLSVLKPNYPSRDDEMLAETRNGLLQLACKLEVAAGSYEGCAWYENITLPPSSQATSLTDKQRTASRIGGALLRAIVESARRIDPKATDARSCRGRSVNGWLDFDGMEFPAKVKLDKEPYIGKDGRTYWRNRISTVIPCTDKEYAEISRGGEIITDGPVRGEGGGAPRGKSSHRDGQNLPYDDTPLADDVPF